MAATTYVCSIEQVARKLNEEQDFIEAIASNDDNLTYGNIVSVQIGEDDYITALKNCATCSHQHVSPSTIGKTF